MAKVFAWRITGYDGAYNYSDFVIFATVFQAITIRNPVGSSGLKLYFRPDGLTFGNLYLTDGTYLTEAAFYGTPSSPAWIEGTVQIIQDPTGGLRTAALSRGWVPDCDGVCVPSATWSAIESKALAVRGRC